jgi:hypothetical protein
MAAEKKPQVPKQLEAGQSDAEASLQAALQEDRDFQRGVDFARLITQAVSEAMRPVIEGHASLLATVDAFGQRIASIERRLPSGEPSQAPPAQTPAAATPTTRARLAVIQGWREQLWYTECGERARMKLPRPTIIGRALYDLSAMKRDHDVTVPDVFKEIAKTGPHHLASSCQLDLDLLASGSKKDRKDASSRLTKRYLDRFEWLERQRLAESEKPDGLWRRWLSDRGRHVFDAWPDWEVSDEAGPEGHGRHQAEAVTSMNTEAAAGGSYGGNRSGSEGLNS